MKRSEINATIKQFEELLDKYKFRIPPYLSFTPEEWAEKDHEWDEIRDNMLGWDITDYGEGDFEHKGLALITLRNGNVKDPKYTKVYAEKIMMSMPGQVSPMHFHWNKKTSSCAVVALPYSTCTMPIRKLKSVSIPRCLCAVTVAVTTCPPAKTSNSMKANP